ncbi:MULTISPECIES: DUF131 domain-containing protein [Acidiplasma]|jgi:uncharacterized protein (TIGR00304 family)|uniref:DUF131 domain-containing protein n=2 Tax=Acidiplasma TaxID=507753 RepID=A0A0N8VLB5_9ARCH|nr:MULTISPECIES: DUF131 domain-containing protein [Acidiplasma]KJE49040.1 hypothetical protein TZ01_07290 [Acidiplasma sp. MBA-1]KPV47138.1 hypothetical protein SE19_02355 [Acidiplasma aeolicum]KQB33614.1 hypothetical protein AOG54_01880 [Acidiplasma aeolicum]KQB36060.1 hypothetical protein AOG55_05115 [Acidiplasma cupricumulans]WMT54486.1 MAG: DUF131 domain-containing protein [Acidiplasma sp.]
MKTYKVGFLLIISGFILSLIFAVLGIDKVGLFLFFPFIISTNPVSIIPFLLIFIGFIMLFISPIFVLRNEYENKYDDYYNNDIYQNLNQDKNVINEDKNKKNSFGGLIMVGPIPIIFGNDKKMIYISMIIVVIIILLYIFFIYHLL